MIFTEVFEVLDEKLKALLESVADGSLEVDSALANLRHLPYEDLGFAKVDHHRSLRDILPEVVMAEGKTPAQVAAIGANLVERSGSLLVTRIGPEAFAALQSAVPEAEYHELARVATIEPAHLSMLPGVVVVCAGTADLPVAEEAVLTARMVGSEPVLITDVGVAGLHRLFDQLPRISEANVLVVIAGMEGALPSVLAGLVSIPIIAVPTSVGYGASFGGLAPLLAMLNSCAAGVSVVNIDNGFGAGYLAAMINSLARSAPPD